MTRRQWIIEQWDSAGLPLLYLVMMLISIYSTPRERLWTLDGGWALLRSVLFFYLLWRIIRNGSLAVQRLESRLVILRSIEDYAVAQEAIADELRRFTARTTKRVMEDLAWIREELTKNMAVTVHADAHTMVVEGHAVTIAADLHALTDVVKGEAE